MTKIDGRSMQNIASNQVAFAEQLLLALKELGANPGQDSVQLRLAGGMCHVLLNGRLRAFLCYESVASVASDGGQPPTELQYYLFTDSSQTESRPHHDPRLRP